MSRILLLAASFLLLGFAASAQRAPVYDSPVETRNALRQALAEREQAQARSERLEQEAASAEDAAQRTARETAALAARVQQAEASIAAAEARSALIEGERDTLREELGREQRPVVRLTAALQQFSRRPVALSVLRPGEVRDVVYLRAVMASAVPEVQARTASLRSRIARSRQLQRQAQQAVAALREEEGILAQRRQQLAAIETRQRLAAREAGMSANRESERALALAEQARDLDGLVGELDRAASLRQRLAALPGPSLRPGEGEQAPLAAPLATSSPTGPANAPAPYILPVAGRTIVGFGAPQGAALSQGITLAPRAGAQVVAPAAGRVAFAGTYRGYGQIVIIEHTGGWTSLVTGLARSDVAVGAELVGGSPIGIAGPGRPTISVELRREGEAVNPLQFTG
ncbi:hypothetical protein GCM10009127_01040 [Alteraurantiacibacter aestuarii]|uniref:Peptidoglycan DD-metalloendopeptidase family protein n=1 Tax=Alteraurantiacibacter aestuarii TaxID=650004 RepID=A0A844ZNP7_9SPHN|nr:peptidoglycan DD-metalloendopeptidase family protein [Alteraurantiacibacter aestuarii]MXO88640.1 peptidoglycan DD-metalloendopeptidase family protein [Alteraurantiacibacter aestuarii]